MIRATFFAAAFLFWAWLLLLTLDNVGNFLLWAQHIR